MYEECLLKYFMVVWQLLCKCSTISKISIIITVLFSFVFYIYYISEKYTRSKRSRCLIFFLVYLTCGHTENCKSGPCGINGPDWQFLHNFFFW